MDQLSFNNINDGIFDRVYINYNGTLQNIVDLIGGGGGGGSIISAVSPLNLTNNVLTLGAFPSSGINILDSNSTNHIISVNTSSQLLLDGNVISGGGGGTVTSATAPLSISSGVLSIDLSSYSTSAQINSMLTNYVTNTQHTNDLLTKIDTTHEANNIGTANVTHLYDFKTQTLTLQNGSGVTAQLSVGLSGNVSIGSDGIVTIPILNAWSPNQLRISDTNNVSRLLTAATNGNLLWNNNILAFTSSLAGYEPLINLTTDRALISNNLGKLAASQITSQELSYLSGTTQNIVTSLAAKQNTLTASTGITLTNNVLEATFRPSRCTAGSGIVLLQSDANGTLTISANGQQTNQYVRLADTNGITYDITADTNGNLLLGSNIITTNPYLVTVLQSYATTASLNNALTNYTTTTNLTTLLNAKQDALTAGEGLYFTPSTNTLNTYALKYQTTGQNVSTPSYAVQEILFKDFNVLEGLNASNQYQLQVALPSSQPISYITNLQTELNGKEDSLQYISEGTTGSNIYYIQTNEQATPGIFLNWTNASSYTNVAGSHQIVNDSSYHGMSSVASSGIITFEMDLQANTASSLLLSVNDATGWTGAQHTTFNLTNSFTTYTTSFNAYSNGNMNIHFNFSAPGQTPATGTVNVRNIRMYQGTPATVTISTNLTVNGTITCTSVTQTSDQSVKDNVEIANLDEIKNIFDNIDVKTYTRNDGVSGSRIGFIAQDFDNVINLDSKIQNIVNPIYSSGQPLLGIDYSRLTTILWGVCKDQEERIKALEANNTSA